jgi:beta-glucosidase
MPQHHESAPMIELDGLRFRDLDHDGELAPYEDRRNPVAVRVTDLIGRMTIEEKVGQLLHGTATAEGPLAVLGIGDEYDIEAARGLVLGSGVTSMVSRLSPSPGRLAEQNNMLQAVAAQGRLGIPITLSTGPRNHFSALAGPNVEANGFSQWPGPLGLAATNDAELVKRFGEVVRQECRAVGFHMALTPQADLATEPRWSRTDGTFGSDPDVVRTCVGAYVRGLQGGVGGVGVESVAAVVKHWVGYGASRDGFDGRSYYGRFSAFPGGHFDKHVSAFLDAFDAGVAGVMATYNILEGVHLDGVEIEQVGAGFNAQLLNELLRGVHGFDGLVMSDWAITKDLSESARTGVPPQEPTDFATCWGVEHLSRTERFAKGVNAGVDQFGGEDDPEPFFEALQTGLLADAQIDAAAGRVLKLKFELGLFDNAFVDAGAASTIVGNDDFRLAAATARSRSRVALKTDGRPAIAPDDVVYLHGLTADAFLAASVDITEDIEKATTAIVRLSTPSERIHPNFFLGSIQDEGDLDFKDGHSDLEALRSISAQVPTTVVVHMNRPAILTNVRDLARAIIVEFGTGRSILDLAFELAAGDPLVPASDSDLVENLTGATPLLGRLPYDLPISMAAVRSRHCDAPTGNVEPLYPFGFRAPTAQDE